MTTLFISDLHLSSAQPEIGHQLCAFLRNEARNVNALYILGDLFEAWIGDDDPDPHYARIQLALKEYHQANPNTHCWFMHGNRDFLVGQGFATHTGFSLLPDPVVHEIEGQHVLLSHGDQYCTDDAQYMAVRKQVRDPAWQAHVLALPVAARQQMATEARAESTTSNAGKSIDIMDVNQQSIVDAVSDAGVAYMLHGHTHRPAIHEIKLSNGTTATRIVLGDWYEQGSVGVWDETGVRLETLNR